ncbi:hypothetical protein I4Q42_22365 [Caulobacter hibisci]|uniref:Uncharacterized protein n=1 Tax=Caulobacter hibisci TaxID=2035993 RepID=A0ABS0T3H0_9CAUL|nr:hypothetical protein [Caulobacter hibisci]
MDRGYLFELILIDLLAVIATEQFHLEFVAEGADLSPLEIFSSLMSSMTSTSTLMFGPPPPPLPPSSLASANGGCTNLQEDRQFRSRQLLLGHRKLDSTVRYLGIEIDDALKMSEQIKL